MRVFITSDWHFGIYLNNLDKWLSMMEDYFYNSFIPYIKKNAKEGDILIHCGDLYDNRTSIPIIASYKAEKILIELSKIIPLHIIVGNHDLWNKGTNEINSVRLFNHIHNIHVYNETSSIEVMGKKLVLMPWIEKRLDMIKEIKYNPGDYLFCHSDLNGCKMHLNSVAHRNDDKIDISEFSGYNHVFSGHIHIRQQNKNFSFVGSPYQMDRNDMGDQKGITILDLPTGKIYFEPNKYSPVFRKFSVKTEQDIDKLDELKGTKDYIDLSISNSLLVTNRKLRRKLEIMLEKINFASVEYIDDIKTEDTTETNESIETEFNEEELDVSIQLEYEEYIKEYILKQKYDNDKFKNGLLNEYNEVIKIFNENYKFNKD
jgi:DNA repair exonuclease SbcCD nuclease subunit